MSDVMRNLLRSVGVIALCMMFVSAYANTCLLRDNGDGTLSDPSSNYRFKICAEGSAWNQQIWAENRRPDFNPGSLVCSNSQGSEPIRITWQEAMGRYQSGTWRLPTAVEQARFGSQLMACNIQGLSWTSTPSKGGHWGSDGIEAYPSIASLNRTHTHAVRLISGDPISTNSGTTSGGSTDQKSLPRKESSQQSQQSQQAQQAAQQSQQLAQQNQALADQERQGQRKTNNPAAQAHQCIDVDKDSALFGGFKNSCEYKVNYVFCNFGPKKNSWAEFHDCERKNGIGAWHAGAGRTSAAHTKNTAMVYWFACKDPSFPVDSVFVLGKGIEARCR